MKDVIRDVLAEFPQVWTYWPVPTGYGRRTIDCLGCYRGRFFGIEAKAPSKKPTLNQTEELQDIDAAMGKTFVIDRTDSSVIGDLRAWLTELTETVPYDPHISRDRVRRRTL